MYFTKKYAIKITLSQSNMKIQHKHSTSNLLSLVFDSNENASQTDLTNNHVSSSYFPNLGKCLATLQEMIAGQRTLMNFIENYWNSSKKKKKVITT